MAGQPIGGGHQQGTSVPHDASLDPHTSSKTGEIDPSLTAVPLAAEAPVDLPFKENALGTFLRYSLHSLGCHWCALDSFGIARGRIISGKIFGDEAHEKQGQAVLHGVSREDAKKMYPS